MELINLTYSKKELEFFLNTDVFSYVFAICDKEHR